MFFYQKPGLVENSLFLHMPQQQLVLATTNISCLPQQWITQLYTYNNNIDLNGEAADTSKYGKAADIPKYGNMADIPVHSKCR